ncbi:MAG: hypothetical protein P8176_07760, partial [Gammaproteobacteria bacterium]
MAEENPGLGDDANSPAFSAMDHQTVGDAAPTLRVGIVGATGYTGSELIKILMAHPRVTLQRV